MIKTIIIDDEPAAGEVLKTLIERHTSQIKICEICYNIPQAIKAIKECKPNIIFLDIELGDGSGFEILEEFKGLEARVVFVTAYEHYAIQAIKYNAFDYILKPILPEELQQTIDKIFSDELKQQPYPNFSALLHQLSKEEEKIAIPTRKGMEYFKLNDIVFIEGQGSYAKLHFTNGDEMLVTKKLKDFEEKLGNSGYMRIHKSYLINLSQVNGVLKEDGGYVEVANNKKLPISATYKKEVLSRINDISNIV